MHCYRVSVGLRMAHAELIQQSPGGLRYFFDSRIECRLIGSGWLPVPAHFSDELKRGGADFLLRGGNV
jgi:hypothetical protein